MPTLLVLRHAEAAASAGRDYERPLTAAGRRAAALAGLAVAAVATPDRALVSSAVRAQATFELARDSGGWDAEAVALDELYNADVPEVFAAVAAHAQDSETLLVVGHEPWCSAFVATLTGARPRLPAATLAGLQVGPAWDALDPEWCALTFLAAPATVATLTTPRA